MLSIQRSESYAKPTNVTLKINIGLSLHRLFLMEFFFFCFYFLGTLQNDDNTCRNTLNVLKYKCV